MSYYTTVHLSVSFCRNRFHLYKRIVFFFLTVSLKNKWGVYRCDDSFIEDKQDCNVTTSIITEERKINAFLYLTF